MRRGIIMKLKNRFTELVKKYKHAWVLLYIFIYMPWFMYLEKHVTTHYHVIRPWTWPFPPARSWGWWAKTARARPPRCGCCAG